MTPEAVEWHRQYNARRQELFAAGDAYKRAVINKSWPRLFLIWPVECLFRLTGADEQMYGIRIRTSAVLQAVGLLGCTVAAFFAATRLVTPEGAIIGLAVLIILARRAE